MLVDDIRFRALDHQAPQKIITCKELGILTDKTRQSMLKGAIGDWSDEPGRTFNHFFFPPSPNGLYGAGTFAQILSVFLRPLSVVCRLTHKMRGHSSK